MAKSRKIKRNIKIYRKRPRIPGWLKFIIGIMLAVAIGFFGGKAILDLWNQTKENMNNDTSTEEQLPSESESSSSMPEESVSAPEEETQQAMSAAVMPQDIMMDPVQRAEFIQNAKNAGSNTILLDLKDETGYFYYQTKNEVAIRQNAVKEGAVDLQQVCQEITDAGMTPAGRISTLMDAVASRVSEGTTYLYQGQEGTAWLDNAADQGGKTWMNPYRENTQKYLVSLVEEIADSGCQIIVVEHLEFPNKNTAAMGINQETISKSQILQQLYDQMETAAEEKQAQLMLQLDLGSYYIGEQDIVYGGSPKEIGAEQVLIAANAQTLSALQNQSVLQGIQPEAEPLRALEAFRQEFSKDGTKVNFLIPKTEQQIFAGIQNADGQNELTGLAIE